jgi:hypothetical protein
VDLVVPKLPLGSLRFDPLEVVELKAYARASALSLASCSGSMIGNELAETKFCLVKR